MTFAELRRRNFLRAMLDTRRGAEEVRFLPSDGQARTIRAGVYRAKTNLRDGEHEQREIEEIDVRVSRDPNASDVVDGVTTVYGGIDRPRQRDRIVRTSLGEDETQAYAFAFVLDEQPDSWLCRFERHTVTQVGLGQTQRV